MANYDFSNFHKGHTKMVIGAAEGIYVVCMDCQVAANMEGISARVSAKDVCSIEGIREAIGKQTAGLDKGGVK